MYLGDVICYDGTPHFRTVNGEILEFLWRGQRLPSDDLWLRTLTSELKSIMFAGIRIGNVLNATRRVGI